MSVHRTLKGQWAECPAPDTCALIFHVPDLTVEAAEQMPLMALLPLFEVLDPPTYIEPDGSKYWLNSEGYSHRDYDLPSDVEMRDGLFYRMRWWQDGRAHRSAGPAVIYAGGLTEYWLHDERLTLDEFREVAV